MDRLGRYFRAESPQGLAVAWRWWRRGAGGEEERCPQVCDVSKNNLPRWGGGDAENS